MSEPPTIVDLRIAGVGAGRLVRANERSLIYRAPHETRGHDVDVEVLPGTQGEAARERFAREQQALGRLGGVEGVVPLLEAGVTVDGDLYLMTPTLGGRTLGEIITADGPMAWPEATRIIEVAAATLHHAHVAGVTHRRIDPDTIVVTDDDRVLVTGLGSAGLTMDAAGTSLPVDVRPGYSAPELSRADPTGVDATTGADPVEVGSAGDIYGLGATLWALLAGRRPFTTAAGDGDERATIIERGATSRIGDLRSVAPASVAEAVEWATAVERERRPSSAATFARALREAAARAPSGFVADPDAMVAGWQALDDLGGDATGPADFALGGAGAASGLAPAVTDSGFAGAAIGTDVDAVVGAIHPRPTVPNEPAASADAGPARRSTTRSADGGEGADASDDGRRAGLIVGLGIAAIALVALAASAVMVAFVGDEQPTVTISGPSIEPGEADAPAEVLGLEVEAEPATAGDQAARSDTADDGEVTTPPEDADASTGQSAVIEPFAIPTPTPEATVLPAAQTGGAAVAGPTQPPATTATAAPAPGTIISAPLPPQQPTPTPQTTISAPPAPPAPASSPTPTAPTETAVPPTVTPTAVDPTPTPDPVEVEVEVVDSPN